MLFIFNQYFSSYTTLKHLVTSAFSNVDDYTIILKQDTGKQNGKQGCFGAHNSKVLTTPPLHRSSDWVAVWLKILASVWTLGGHTVCEWPCAMHTCTVNPGYNEPLVQRTPGYNEPSRWAPPWRIQVQSRPLQRISGYNEPFARVQKGSLYPGFTVPSCTILSRRGEILLDSQTELKQTSGELPSASVESGIFFTRNLYIFAVLSVTILSTVLIDVIFAPVHSLQIFYVFLCVLLNQGFIKQHWLCFFCKMILYIV